MKYVYFLYAQGTNLVKIGTSQDPFSRLRSIRAAIPFPLVLLFVAKGGYSTERRVHEHFSDYQLLNEWFDCYDKLDRESLGEIMQSSVIDPCDMHFDTDIDELYNGHRVYRVGVKSGKERGCSKGWIISNLEKYQIQWLLSEEGSTVRLKVDNTEYIISRRPRASVSVSEIFTNDI